MKTSRKQRKRARARARAAAEQRARARARAAAGQQRKGERSALRRLCPTHALLRRQPPRPRLPSAMAAAAVHVSALGLVYQIRPGDTPAQVAALRWGHFAGPAPLALLMYNRVLPVVGRLEGWVVGRLILFPTLPRTSPPPVEWQRTVIGAWEAVGGQVERDAARLPYEVTAEELERLSAPARRVLDAGAAVGLGLQVGG